MKLECNFFAGSAHILNEETVMDVIKEKTKELEQEDPFYILDVGDIVQKIKVWKLKLPRVKPFYAMKCNDHPTVLEILAALGIGFDCASKTEIQKILELGVDQSRIIYANPCKPASHLRLAAKLQVPLMTFDNETELHKIKAYYPDAKLVIRIRVDSDALCHLGVKFGVFPEDAEALMVAAHDLGLNVVGVSFHVGSGCRDPSVFYRAIASSKMVFEKAVDLGFSPYLLDIGGGFPGSTSSCLDEFAEPINRALDMFFPEGCGVEIIAEPGRYVVASAFTLATSIIAKREVNDANGSLESIMYYINDGVYGSFNGILYEDMKCRAVLLEKHDEETHVPCSVWGPTCDGIDQIASEISLPRLPCGEWLVWPEMGAYTLVAAGTFNGFPVPKVFVVVPHHTWLYLEEHLGCSFSLASVEVENEKPFLAKDQHKMDGSLAVTKNAATPYICAANTLGSVTMEDHMAQLSLFGIGEM
ncbi:ornithine decarboxylase-like [Portunus trituberculatus]|uniref:ornithine decarboxylase-like n=1 Tax=Portunus trituberculatus TaxID=210409 RepID=UPI001E1CEBD5|nr:ornithine decarboxylase-like [Portunus trituberculatus]XP_045127466.1 ornithine decarboxylase-like [Portunus trituberculatus]